MSLNNILAACGISEYPECWETAFLEYPENLVKVREYLIPENIDLMASMVDLPDDFVELLEKSMDYVRKNESLTDLAGICYAGIFQMRIENSGSWPLPVAMPDDLKAMFRAVVLTAGLPHMLAIHRNLGVPESVTRECLSDIRVWAEDYREKNGKPGFAQTDWLQYTYNGRLFRLGRLQFMYGGCRDFYIYRNKSDGRTLVLAGVGVSYRTDGKVNGTNGIYDENAWISTVILDNNSLRGNPVSADGRAVREQVTIDLDEWDKLMDADSSVLDVHIPAGEKMDYAACIDSFRQANEFYPRYFPEQKYCGFTCASWLLDPNLQNILPADSNIVRFQKEFYLIPVLSNEGQTFERVFNCTPEERSIAPAKTSLQRAILQYLSDGNNVHGSYGFIPADEAGCEHKYTRIAIT